MYDVIAIGELLIDFTSISVDSDGYPTMAAHPGGAPANLLAALAKFGAKTSFIGKIGKDKFGELLVNTLKSAGIGTEGLLYTDDVFTTLAFVTLDFKGNREFSFARKPGADTRIASDEIDLSLINDTKVFHFGTLSLTDEPSRTATIKAVEYARSVGKIVSFDPNLRKPLWSDLNDAKRQMLWGMNHADIIKISDDEVRFLFDVNPEIGIGLILENFGAKLIFVTCGAEGSYYGNKTGIGNVSGLTNIKVLDTTGAGDIFGGSALWKYLQLEKQPDLLSINEMRSIAEFACVSASLSTTKFGGISAVPEMQDILRYIST